ncbi:MAG: ABC transporter ATP-binding protein/permease [Gammaproteobacteria bacterium]|nr:ABC transporter ATP-binding protein/permease [Gammaproteobacteria bacterium]
MHTRHTELPESRSNSNDLHTLRTLFPFLWQYRGRVLLAISCLILAKVANVGIPLLLKEIVDQLNINEKQPLIILPLALLLAYGSLRLTSSLFNELRDAIFAKVRHGATRSVSVKLLQHLYQLSLRFHLDRKTGGISRDMERGTRSVSSLLNYMAFSILPTLVEITLIAIILLSNYDLRFTLIALSSVIVYILFTFRITQWRMQFRTTMNRMDSQANTRAIDGMINYETIKYFNNQDLELRRYDESLAGWEQAAVKSQTSMAALNFGQSAIIAVAVTLIMILAADGVVDGTLTIGDLVAVNAFLIQLFIPLNFLGIVYSQLKHAIVDMQCMFDLMEEKPEIEDITDAPELDISDASIHFNHVDFAYNPERPILKDINFEIQTGHKVAIVGPSGSGKSTLSRLLFRFYDVSAGEILINKQDISKVRQESLRANIGIVPQDTLLFNDSLYYNIAYARVGASMEDVIEAACKANIHQFIESLPEGYDTVVGERGLKLSGGEKQRVAIARTILKNPKILIFDEATSNLDSQSEQVILKTLRQAAEHHTSLVIAHRLSTIIDADNILVMDKGRIVEQGTHQQLLQGDGLYSQLWALQQQEEK